MTDIKITYGKDAAAIAEPNVGSGDSNVYNKPLYRGYVLAILTLVYVFNFIDRQLLVILQEPIKAELHLSDTQLGLLSGFTFAVFYVVCGIPIARWADKGSRRTIIALAITVWSAMTAVSGFIQNFMQLLAARIGVGVGEAGCSPAAHSMISDIYGLKQRATALSIYSTGIYLGILAGFVLGGWIGQFFGWRVAFLIVGLPGIALALLFRYSVQEPSRGWSQGIVEKEGGASASFVEVIRLLWSRRAFRHIALAAGLQGFVGYGLGNWTPSYFIRQFDIGMGELGTWLGLTAGLAGALGTFAGGYLTDRLGVRDKRWYLWIPAGAIVLVIPATLVMLSLAHPYAAMLLNVFPNLLIPMYLGPVLAMTHGMVGMRMRALSSAVLFFVLNLVGLGLGPTTIGILSDLLEPSFGSESLRYTLMLTVSIASLWCCAHHLLAARTLRQALEQAPA